MGGHYRLSSARVPASAEDLVVTDSGGGRESASSSARVPECVRQLEAAIEQK